MTDTVNLEIFERILFSWIALKDIFATLKIPNWSMVYLYQETKEWSHHFASVLFSRNFAYAKFRENKTLAKFPNLQYYFKIFFCCLLLTLFKINFLKTFLLAKLFWYRSGKMLCWPWSRSKLFAKTISRWQNIVISMKELRPLEPWHVISYNVAFWQV